MSTTEPGSNPNRVRGRVVEFDEHRGLGTVSLPTGDTYMFHCVEILDGSRRIVVGTDVEFHIREKFSRPEAFSVAAV
jgi:hypothetical protein